MAVMNRLLILAVGITVFSQPAIADSAEELNQWFRDGYAALYVENAWEKADEFAQYLADEIAYRSDEGLVVVDVNGFVVDSLDEWRNEGWLGTDVAGLKTVMLNATTAVFDITWVDRYAGGSREQSARCELVTRVQILEMVRRHGRTRRGTKKQVIQSSHVTHGRQVREER